MRWFWSFALVGCTGSPGAPPACEGFANVQFLRDIKTSVLAVAVGGTANLRLECTIDAFPGSAPFDLPSTVTTEPASVARVDREAATMFVHGVHDATTTVVVRSSDGATTYGSLAVTVATTAQADLRTQYDQVSPNAELVFARELGAIASPFLASSDGTALLDDDAQLTPPPGVMSINKQLFDYSAIPLGTYSVDLASAGTKYSVPFEVVDHADSIALVDPGVTVPANGDPRMSVSPRRSAVGS